MVFLGDGCSLHIRNEEIVPSKHLYKKGHEPTSWGGAGCTRCVDSYIVSNKCAKKLMEHLNNMRFYKVDMHIDHYLNVMARNANLNVYWAEPTIVTQGSESGLFTSSHDK